MEKLTIHRNNKKIYYGKGIFVVTRKWHDSSRYRMYDSVNISYIESYIETYIKLLIKHGKE